MKSYVRNLRLQKDQEVLETPLVNLPDTYMYPPSKNDRAAQSAASLKHVIVTRHPSQQRKRVVLWILKSSLHSLPFLVRSFSPVSHCMLHSATRRRKHRDLR